MSTPSIEPAPRAVRAAAPTVSRRGLLGVLGGGAGASAVAGATPAPAAATIEWIVVARG